MRGYDGNIVIIGMPGSGKTTIGKLLAKSIGFDFCDMDDYIEKEERKTIKEIFIKGEEHFRELESRAAEELSKVKRTVISTGGGVVLKGKNMLSLRQWGIVFFIDRPVEKIAEDIDISGRPLLWENKDRIYLLFEQRHNLYKEYSDYVIKNDGKVSDAVEQIIVILEANCHENPCD